MTGVSAAFANHGRWLAMCGHRHACDGAATLQRFQMGFICQSCGRATDVVWPSADMVEGVERLLMMRPHYKNRNWEPTESLHDLLFENGQHGVLLPSGPGHVISIEGDKIIADALPGQSRHSLST